jgi:PAS domain S-box-containing protein
MHPLVFVQDRAAKTDNEGVVGTVLLWKISAHHRMDATTKFLDVQSIFYCLKDAFLVLDSDGYIKYFNPATTTITGYEAAELNNKTLAFFYDNQNDITKADYELSLARKHGKFVGDGWRHRKDGSRFWGELTLSPFQDGRTGFMGYLCQLRDVSERKEVEIQLRHSEQMYRLMVEGVRDYAIFLMSPTGHIMTWNEGARRIKGYAPSEIIGKHFSTFYTREDLDTEKPRRELEIATATGKYEEEGWRVRKDGSVFWANVVITALFSEQNKLIGFSKVTRDLTERRRNEESLRQSEERYRFLVEQVMDYGIFMMDEKGRIVSWNAGAQRISGYTADEIIGKYFSIFYPEEDILNGKPVYELKVARETGKYEEEGWRLRKDGSPFWASVVITAVYNAGDALIGFSKVTRDLTERKEAEQALHESNERYRRLTEELRTTNSELSYANSELEQFTSIVSHDLQEPIRTIKSFLQLIQIKLDSGQHQGLEIYIAKAIQAANRIRELIQNLLYYSQLGRNEVVTEQVNVDDLFNKALQNLKTSLESAGAEITIENEVESISGDPVQLLQLVQNLLSNAIKFTNSEKPQVKIRSTIENGHVRFAVSDNGIGIAQGDLDKVFEIFRRLDTQKDYPGTGIGLAICKKIVDRHRGRIWPESVPGKGTTFYFTLNEQLPTELPEV